MNKNKTIGILGGMGTYATIHCFRQYAQIFSAQKEWERPRIIIDNRCTMPSRVRAFLYGENTNELVDEMVDSIRNLIKSGCDYIILACNTSHLFLPYIFEKLPEAEKYIVSIIDKCVEQIIKENIKKVFILGSEGTIDSKIYQEKLESYGVICETPKQEEYHLLRECIEAVKQDSYSTQVKETFFKLLQNHKNCLLGCTELPILYEKYYNEIKDVFVYDPVAITLEYLKGVDSDE